MLSMDRNAKEGVMADQPEGKGVVEQLRSAIRTSGRSLNQLSEACGVDSGRLSRFMRGERDLTLAAADAICGTLGLHLAPKPAPAEDEPKRRRGKAGN
jgi:transcriptional regulator with XRE-family HTH domain